MLFSQMILQVEQYTLQLPSYNVTSGSYIIQAEVRNGYVDETQTATLNIANQFESNIVADNPVQSY